MYAPYVEKYRPTCLSDIVLSPENRQLCARIVDTRYFPHLLLFGPPGVGKTTTVLALLSAYDSHAPVLHLNASDERGIDTITDHVTAFVSSKPDKDTLKFVVMDEIDYMASDAQHALQRLLHQSLPHVRYCLICNYVSKVVPGLQRKFVKLAFHHLPADETQRRLLHVLRSEGRTDITKEQVAHVQQHYRSDMRAMLNWFQHSSHAGIPQSPQDDIRYAAMRTLLSSTTPWTLDWLLQVEVLCCQSNASVIPDAVFRARFATL